METSRRASGNSHGTLQVVPRSASTSTVYSKSLARSGSARGLLAANSVLPSSIPVVSNGPSGFAASLTKSKSFNSKRDTAIDKHRAGMEHERVDDVLAVASTQASSMPQTGSTDLASLCRRMFSVFTLSEGESNSHSRTASTKFTDAFRGTTTRRDNSSSVNAVFSLDTANVKVNDDVPRSLDPRPSCEEAAEDVAAPKTPPLLKKLEAEHTPWAPMKSARPMSRRFTPTAVPFGLIVEKDGAVSC